ncbi:hypothetical protein BC939DRAFT_503701 [Gamsiella multidivaricata]|uniref:uncharacterized protein n=1 Tax=Gamsiella multidivaricata TaxID=101098 RepID=UPI00221FDF81|nr:uncharacterized protein BC939DRAFT_503701 [Gamsiella multidivaricata]KAI7822696.1 hypothetical protein BC939DRAFT_503701 [Gamsiella multidivaricata]
MVFGGYNSAGSSELPLSTAGSIPSTTTMRSRSGSFSSVHSNHNNQDHQPSRLNTQQQQHSLYQSPYSSQPSTPVGSSGDYFNTSSNCNTGAYRSNGYDTYGPASASQQQYQHHPLPMYNRGVSGNSGYDDDGGHSSGVLHTSSKTETTASNNSSSKNKYDHRSHSRSRSNASETSLSIDTDLAGHYEPDPVSRSSANSSRRGSISEASGLVSSISGGGGFFSRRKVASYRPAVTDVTSPNGDDDLGMDLDSRSPHRLRQKRTGRRSSSMGAEFLVQNRMGRVSDILNDWDLLLPSGGPYGNDEADDEDMTENERWKKQQLSRRGWESTRGQGIILGSLTILAVLVKIWKLAVPSAVVYVFEEQE